MTFFQSEKIDNFRFMYLPKYRPKLKILFFGRNQNRNFGRNQNRSNFCSNIIYLINTQNCFQISSSEDGCFLDSVFHSLRNNFFRWMFYKHSKRGKRYISYSKKCFSLQNIYIYKYFIIYTIFQNKLLRAEVEANQAEVEANQLTL